MPLRLQVNTRLCVEQLEPRELLSTGVWGLLQPHAIAAATAPDDYGNTFAQAAPVSLAGTGSGSQLGRIGQARDVDMFRFVAPVTGQMTITQSAAPGSRLDSYLYVYSAGQQLLAGNDDSGGTLNSRVQINVVAGTSYYVKAAAYGRSTGDYVLQFTAAGAVADDYANDFAHAALVNVSSSGSGSQSGRIGPSGDVDMFRFVAPVSGQMTITQSAAPGSRLDSYLYVYDGNQQLLAYNDDSGGTLNSQVQINVVAGATYYIKASAYPGSSGAYTLRLSTVADAPPPTPGPTPAPGAFQIDVTMTGLTSSQQQIVQQAADRWEQIIVGDLPDVVYNGRTIDDVQIAISGVTIDGTGGILGQSSATAVRSGSDLPYLGFIQLDTADVAAMQTSGSLLGVLEHEIAHVLGFGVIWSDLGLLSGAGTSNPGFTGPRAVAEYNSLFGTTATSVPVEADGGAGTRLSHWDETVFGTELMTGWYNSGQVNALSRITVASMADLGYQVNMAAADPYTPPASRSVAATAVASSQSSYQSFRTSSHTSSRARQADRLCAVDLFFRSESAGQSI
jgi:hypothetical protein